MNTTEREIRMDTLLALIDDPNALHLSMEEVEEMGLIHENMVLSIEDLEEPPTEA